DAESLDVRSRRLGLAMTLPPRRSPRSALDAGRLCRRGFRRGLDLGVHARGARLLADPLIQEALHRGELCVLEPEQARHGGVELRAQGRIAAPPGGRLNRRPTYVLP